MSKLSLEILKLCLQYRRCRSCGKIKPRGKVMGCSFYYCSLCRAEKIDLRDEFQEWYNREGKKFEEILPNPMPTLQEIGRMIRQAKRERA